MPIYEYRCERGHTFEATQRMTDDPLTSCSACEAPVQRVFHPVAVHFKGSGFYSTDYGKTDQGSGSSDSTAKSESKETSPSESKKDAGSQGSTADSKSSS